MCIGTDFESQQKYDSFMQSKGISPHLDWHNLSTEEMQEADFPLYVYDQKVGDLVVLPPATAHQIWNPSILSTKLVWNILHPLSLEVGIQHVQPPFNRLCHPDVARTNLSLAYAMLSLVEQAQGDTMSPSVKLPPDLPLLSKLFRRMVHDESIDSPENTQITQVTLQQGTIATCNFCSTAIWNRHVRCSECADFDLCLLCYLNGRSCEHSQSYTWAELVSPEKCNRVLVRAREILGFQPEEPRLPDRQKTLGTAVNDLMQAKLNESTKLCHLCRIDHPEWKGKRCDSCTAFFCYRGLYRHFDIQPTDVLRHSGIWTCPKCEEICNCRCCHFTGAYTKSEKPASKRRVKAADARGKNMGFADNVFDQKRGVKRESASAGPLTVAHIVGKKRTIDSTGLEGPSTPLRKLDLPTPEPDFSHRTFVSREGSEFGSVVAYPSSSFAPILPSVRNVADGDLMSGISDDRMQHLSPSTAGFGANGHNHILPSYLATASIYDSSKTERKPRPPNIDQLQDTTPRRQTSSSYINTVTHATQSPPRSSIPHTQYSNYTLHTQSHTDTTQITPITESPPVSSIVVDESIKKLEARIITLKAYDDEFAAMKLEDSRRLLRGEIQDLEAQLEARRKEKGLGLIERLRREGFDTLAEAVGFEVGVGTYQPSQARTGLGMNFHRGTAPNM